MAKKFQRIISGMLAVLLVVLLSPAVVLTADALQCRTENFLKTYTLTGDGASDMVAIALAQESRTGSEFGYTEQWCANFVSDCAILAGQTAAIPANGQPSAMYTKVLAAGGTISTSDPKPGDLCFINWSGGSTASHVEIVYEVTSSGLYTIGGNSGSTGSLYTRYVKKHDPIGASYVLATVRPAYTSTVEDYLNQCTYYNCYATITSKAGAAMMSLPCDTSVSAASVQLGTTAGQDVFAAKGLYLNTAGEYWYLTSDSGMDFYIYGGNTTAVTPLYSDLSISSVKAPSSITAGSSFSIGGTIATEYNLITDVEARVYSGDTITLNSSATGVNAKSFTLRSSAVDKGLKFGTLAVGSYTYNVRATVENHYTTDGLKRIDSTDTQILHETTFNVVDGTAPVFASVTVSDLSSQGYTVNATITDDVALDRVVFSAYTANGDGDDLTGTTVDADGTEYTYTVWASDHNNESGTYITDITAYDAAGNSTAYSLEVEVPDVDGGSCGTNLIWSLGSDGKLTISGTGDMKIMRHKAAMPWYDYLNDITAVVIEEGVTTISDFAFYGMPNLRTIEIADTVTTIGNYTFKNCTALDGVVLPANLSQLGESSFYACSSLSAIEIPASLWSIKPYTFKNCTALKELTLNEGNLMKIWDAAFYNTGLTSVVLPDCLDILDIYVFKNCADLAEVTLSDSMTEIRAAAFYGTAISTIELTDGITAIGAYAFKSCENLETVSMTENLTTISDSAFHTCTALTALTIPENVDSIGAYCFSGSSDLEQMTFTGDAPTIGTSAFKGLNLTARYPGSNSTWTADVMQNYGGNVTWTAQ